MLIEYLSYVFTTTAAAIELAKTSVEKGSVLFPILAAGGTGASLLGGVFMIIALQEKSWLSIILISILCSTFCALNINALVKIFCRWNRQRKINKLVPGGWKTFRECVQIGSTFLEEKYPGIYLWEDLLISILEIGVLTQFTLSLLLEEVRRSTCPHNCQSSEKAKRKLQAILLAAECSGVENSGAIIGRFLQSLKVSLYDEPRVKIWKVYGAPTGWKITFPEKFVPAFPGDALVKSPLEFIDYTNMVPITPGFNENTLHECGLCQSLWSYERIWSFKAIWRTIFKYLSFCPVCGLFKAPKSNKVEVVGDHHIVEINPSEGHQPRERAGSL